LAEKTGDMMARMMAEMKAASLVETLADMMVWTMES